MFEFLKYSGIKYYSCNDLKKEDWLILREPIEDKYIKNLRYLMPNVKIDFDYDDYDNIFKCIKFLQNKYKKITISVKNKEKFKEAISKIDIKLLDLNKIEIDQPSVITTYMLFTSSENDLAKQFQYDDKFIIFNINSLDDFYIKCNELKERFGLSNSNVLSYILNFIEELEPDVYNSLIDIHNKNKKDINLTLEEIGKHLIKRVNKKINQKKIWKAVRVVYNNSYGYKDSCAMNDDLKKVIDYNNIRRKNHFYTNNK